MKLIHFGKILFSYSNYPTHENIFKLLEFTHFYLKNSSILDSKSDIFYLFSWYDMTDYLPGTAGLIEEIDKKHLVVLRDGRTLIGFLRAIDQFANLVLHQTVERIHVDGYYGDIPRGIFVVRGIRNIICNESLKMTH